MAFITDETKTAAENFTLFLEGQKEITYTLGDYSGTPEGDMQLYTELKIAVDQENKKKADFYTLREAAFKTLEDEHNVAKTSLADTWQEYENNDYTIAQ